MVALPHISLREPLVSTSLSPHAMTSHVKWLKISRGGSIYTMEIANATRPGFIFPEDLTS